MAEPQDIELGDLTAASPDQKSEKATSPDETWSETPWDELCPIAKPVRENLVETANFEYFILTVILVNCIFLAMDNPNEDNSLQDLIDGPLEIVFTVIYSIEVVVKWIAWGFYGHHRAPEVEDDHGEEEQGLTLKSANDKMDDQKETKSASLYTKIYAKLFCLREEEVVAMQYEEDEDAIDARSSSDGSYWGYFRDGWNWFDFIIVVIGSYFPIVFGLGSVSSLRALRVLKALRTLKALPKLRILVSTLIGSLMGLFDVCVLLGFLFLIFAIMGTQLFMGDLEKRCVPDNNPNINMDFVSTTSEYSGTTLGTFGNYCKESNDCLTGSSCLRLGNPNNGLSSFDNAGVAMLQVMQIVTLEEWTGIMFALYDSVSPFIWFYFILITFVVSFYAVNLILAVIVDVYQNETKSFLDRSDKDNVLDDTLARLAAYEEYDRGMNDDEIGVGHNDAGRGRRIRELMKSFAEVLDNDRRRIELNPYHQVSFHLRFETEQATAQWNEVKAWKYRCAIAQGVNNIGKELENPLRPIDVHFGHMTNYVLVVFLRVKSVDDVPTMQRLIEGKDTQEKIIEAYNEGRSLCIEKMRAMKEDEESPRKKAERAGLYNFYKDQSEFNFAIKFNHNFNVWFLNETNKDFSLGATDGLKEMIVELFKGQPEMDFDTDAVVLGSNAEQELLVSIGGAPKRAVGGPITKRMNNLCFSIPESSSDSANSVDDSKVFKIHIVILTGHKFSGVDAGSATGFDANPFASNERKGRIVGAPDQNVDSFRDSIHKQMHTEYDDIPKGDDTFAKVCQVQIDKEEEELIEKVERFNGDAAFKLMTVSKQLPNEWLEGAGQWVRTCNVIAESDIFSIIINLIIFANTIVLACVWDGQSQESEDLCDILNDVFNVIFLLEAVIKISGLGMRFYWTDNWNKFDFSLVVVGTFDMVISYSADGNVGTGPLLAFRALRLMRVFRLLGKIKSLRILLSSILEAIAHVSNLILIFLLLLFAFGVLGVQLFAGSLQTGYAQHMPWSYDSFWQGMVTTFQLFTGDDWTSVMWLFCDQTGNSSVVYFIPTVLIGSFVMMNLFIAILLSRIQEQNDFKIVVEEFIDFATMRRKAFEVQFYLKYPDAELNDSQKLYIDNKVSQAVEKELRLWRKQKSDDRLEIYHDLQRAKKLKRYMTGVSCNMFPPENDLRARVHDLVHSKGFEWTIILLILVNCIFLALDTPHASDSRKDMLLITDIIFTTVFTIEMGARIFADGLLQAETAYLKDGWNCIDAFVVIVALISMGAPSIAALRAIRAIRPIRVGIRVKQVRRVINSLFKAIPQVLQVALFCFFFWFVLAVFGIHLFKGRYGRCVCPTPNELAPGSVTPTNCVINFNQVLGKDYPLHDKDACMAAGYHWEINSFNFDNVFEAILTVYKVGTMSGWWKEMFIATSDDGGSNSYLGYDWRSPVAALYFMVTVIVAGFFSLNLFISVVVDSFQREKENGSAILSQKQTIWVMKQRLMTRLALPKEFIRPKRCFTQQCFDVCTHWSFDPLIMTCIVANAIVLMIDYYNAPDTFVDILEFLNLVFVIIFSFEAFFKIMGLGPYDYWEDHWNKFDFIIVVASLIGLIAGGADAIASVFRIIRVLRVLRLINKAPLLRALFMTLVFSSPSLVNIGSLLFIIFFIFAVLGVALFGNVAQLDPNYAPFIPLRNTVVSVNDVWNEGFNNRINFDNFANALIIVYRMATGDSWEDVYAGATLPSGWKCDYTKWTSTRTFSDLNDDRDCGNIGLGILYFVLFGILGTMIFTNLFIAVILDVYKDNVDLERNLANLPILYKLKTLWIEEEKKWREEHRRGRLRGFVPVKNFLTMLSKMPEMVGLMLNACNLRLELDEQEVYGATQEEFDLYNVDDVEQLAAKAAVEFCGKLKRGVENVQDASKTVTKDHLGAIIDSHKWDCMCRIENPGKFNDEVVVYWEDAVFSLYNLINGIKFPINRYDSAKEMPLAKAWAVEKASKDFDDDMESEEMDMDALDAEMEGFDVVDLEED